MKIIAYIKSLAPNTGVQGAHRERRSSAGSSAVRPTTSYLTDENTIWSWLFTTDHKRIALLYFVSITLFFFLGGAAAAVMRLNLMSPGGLVVDHEMYNRLFTLHGVVMVWFFLVPAIPVTLGNFVTPLMLGARDLAFPRVNLASWYLFMRGGVARSGRPRGGRRGYRLDVLHAALHRLCAGLCHRWSAVGIILSGYSSIATGLNFIVTIHKTAPARHGLVPVAAVPVVALRTCVIYVLATPVLAMAMVLLHVRAHLPRRRVRPGARRRPAAVPASVLVLLASRGLYHDPAGFGVVSEVITRSRAKASSATSSSPGPSVSIAVIGFFVWGHHMFVAGTSLYSSIMFSLLSFIVAVPSAIKVFNWLGTLHKGFIRFDAPMLYTLGFIGLFTMGGLTGLFVAALAADVHLHDTYFVVAHFHYIMVGAMVSAFFAGLHYWWPKITGRMYPRDLGSDRRARRFSSGST